MVLIDFINENENWEDILTAAPYNVKVTTDGLYKILKYNQIESDFGESIVQECRGCVITMYNNKWYYVARPFDKFFNAGEPFAADIDWASPGLTVTEKIDGSLCKVWYDRGMWHISTNGTINAFDASTGCILDGYTNFGDLFLAALRKYYAHPMEFFNQLDIRYTHMFELVSPYSRVVVPYDDIDVYYLDSRDTQFGKYCRFNISMPSPQSIQAENLDDVVKICAEFDWTKEGFVIFDGVNRLKCKSPAYVRAHHLRNNGNVTYEKLLEVILAGEISELLVYAPEYTEKCDEISNKLTNTRIEGGGLIEKYKPHLELPRKEYAMLVADEDIRWSAFLFKYYDNHNLTFDEWFNSLNVKVKLRIIEC